MLGLLSRLFHKAERAVAPHKSAIALTREPKSADDAFAIRELVPDRHVKRRGGQLVSQETARPSRRQRDIRHTGRKAPDASLASLYYLPPPTASATNAAPLHEEWWTALCCSVLCDWNCYMHRRQNWCARADGRARGAQTLIGQARQPATRRSQPSRLVSTGFLLPVASTIA